jgi:hypothetical protein
MWKDVDVGCNIYIRFLRALGETARRAQLQYTLQTMQAKALKNGVQQRALARFSAILQDRTYNC